MPSIEEIQKASENATYHAIGRFTLTRQDAIEKATALAKAEMDKLDNPE